MNTKNLIGQIMNHLDLGKVKVVSCINRSRTLVEVEILDKGKGWDEQSQSYKGHTNKIGWMRGENRECGNLDVVHRKELTAI